MAQLIYAGRFKCEIVFSSVWNHFFLVHQLQNLALDVSEGPSGLNLKT